MKRILPFYKNENLSPSGLGYSSMKSALKYMKISDQLKQDFNDTLPKDYWDKYSYIYKLENPWSPDFKREDRGIHESGGRFYTAFFTKGWADISSPIDLDDIPEYLKELFKTAKYTESETEYLEILYKLLSWGYYPTIFRNESNYTRLFNKFIKSNVEFREVELKIEEV